MWPILFTILVISLMIGIGIYTIYTYYHKYFKKPEPDAIAGTISLYAADPECDVQRWKEMLPQLYHTFAEIGAKLDLWDKDVVLDSFAGTYVVLHSEPWVNPWTNKKVAGLARYRQGIHIIDELPVSRTALAREWLLMLFVDMGGDEEYVLQLKVYMDFIKMFHQEVG